MDHLIRHGDGGTPGTSTDPSPAGSRPGTGPIPADPAIPRLSRRVKDLLPINRDFTVSYRTQIPRAIRSYHVTVDLPEEINVRRFALVTDADAAAVESLAADLRELAEHSHHFAGADGAAYRAELQDALARTASLTRARLSQLGGYSTYLRD